MPEPVKCPVCGGMVYRNKSGKLLAHTRSVPSADLWGRPSAEPCSGATKGARP